MTELEPDIVERLRELELYDSDLNLFEEAATEIEWLRERLREEEGRHD